MRPKIPGIEDIHSKQIFFLLKALPPKTEVVLFGSRAKGNYREGSDIDLALKGPNLDLGAKDSLLARYDKLLLPWKLDVIVYSLIEEPALKEHIDRVGVLLSSDNDRP